MKYDSFYCTVTKAGVGNNTFETLKMKQPIIITAFLLTAFSSTAQKYYTGLERMCWTNQKGKLECYDAPRKWFHLNTILIDKDSVFLYKVPVRIDKKDTLYSASDGAFYYYYGVIRQIDTSQNAYLISHNCDYCATMVREDSLTGFNFPVPKRDTLKVSDVNHYLTIGKIRYKPARPGKDFYFPAKTMFYFDSNSISRLNPKNQYGLILQGIRNFLQTKQLKTDNDTLRICTDRYERFEQNKLIETLAADSLRMDTANIHFAFFTRNQLTTKAAQENKVIRYIEVDEIIDYWKAARIELTYKIIVPKSFHRFSEKEYNNSFEYDKVANKYELKGALPENSWGLVEQK